MCDDQNDRTAPIGHNKPPHSKVGSKIVKPPRIEKSEIDKLGNKQKFGKRTHVGLTFKMIQAFGGLKETLGRQGPAQFFEQFYEPDEKELATVRDSDVVVDESDEEKRPPRPWREDRSQKTRCGQISVSVLEAGHMLYHLSVGVGQEAASLFSLEDMVRLHPSQIIDRILSATPGLSSPPKNPVLLLKLLAEYQGRASPNIDIVSGMLQLTNQGDGRIDGMQTTEKTQVLAPGQEFFLDISFETPPGGAQSPEAFVFEYSLAPLKNENTERKIVALPMPYLQASETGFHVLNNAFKSLKATGTPGSYGFAVIIWHPADNLAAMDKQTPTLLSLLAEFNRLDEWTRTDLNAVIQGLRRELVQENPRISIGLLDYVKG